MAKKVIISGGGTGGHVFPAIAIANALKQADSNIEILFVGALGKLEMQKVPEAGYQIKGLPIRGFARKFSLKNLIIFYKIKKSLNISGKIIRQFKPDVVVGVGGYASGPLLWKATQKGIPTLIQEQNSYAGITNRLLSKRVNKICVAYDNMERFFPAQKIIKTGNPVRKNLLNKQVDRQQAIEHFGLEPDKRTLLITGGSGGARTINQSIITQLETIKEQKNLQVIWQCGKYYLDQARESAKQINAPNVKVMAFISKMELAYNVADVVIARAGAGTISELCLIEKPVILIPSPNVAEDHQTKNAMALVEKKAAIIVKDHQAKEKLIEKALELINDSKMRKVLSANIARMAVHNSAEQIAGEVLKLTH